MTRIPIKKLVKAGKYAAEVDVALIETDHEWAPYLEPVGVCKLDAVRQALRDGDLKAAAKLARVYRLTPVAADISSKNATKQKIS